MNGPAAPFARESLRSGFDEQKSAWVLLPDGKQYLLPIIQRHQRIVPILAEGGGFADIEVKQPEGELPKLIDDFFLMLGGIKNGEITIATIDAYTSLLTLVRALILFNYDLPDSRIAEILTMDKRQIEMLFNSLVRHIAMSA